MIYKVFQKSLGHNLTLNISKTIKDIAMRLLYLKACSLKFFMECSKMLIESNSGHTAHTKSIALPFPTAFQFCSVDGCNSFHYSSVQFIHVFWKERHID